MTTNPLDIQRGYSQLWYARNKETKKTASKEAYAYRRGLGICPVSGCDRPPVAGRVMCAKHGHTRRREVDVLLSAYATALRAVQVLTDKIGKTPHYTRGHKEVRAAALDLAQEARVALLSTQVAP